MRHLKGYRKLNRTSSHRKAMFRNMVTSLFRHGQITTTLIKAKELRRIAEKIVTLTKRVHPDELTAGTPEEQRVKAARRVHAIRLARDWVQDREVLQTLFSDYSTRYTNRAGGYTRIMKLGFRAGDNTAMALIQMLPADAPAAAPSAPESTQSAS